MLKDNRALIVFAVVEFFVIAFVVLYLAQAGRL
jgi:hypothetical protein